MKGRVAVVGATAMDLERRAFYDKELELRMSMSYGPGRYDRRYEELGLDYPLSYVRWTENRNLQAFIALAAAGDIDPGNLDAQIVPFSEAERSYEELAKGERKSLAVIFRYEGQVDMSRKLSLRDSPAGRTEKNEVGVAFIGAGNYAKGLLLPAVAKVSKVRPISIVTATGSSARRSAEKFDYASCGTDPGEVFSDPAVDLVFIATQHDSHASLAEEALRAGKSVWLEKPAGLTSEEVQALIATAGKSDGLLSVGYNRRFSSHTTAVRKHFAKRQEPMALRYTVAAGTTPAGTWITDPRSGGGRIIGEMCHFVDLCLYLVGGLPTTVYARALGRDPDRDDSTVATLGFRDGSTAVIEYLANASSELPKERWEASAQGTTASCENFRSTRIAGGTSTKTMNQDKGQQAAVKQVIDACRAGQPSPFSLEELAATSETTFAILESIRTGQVVDLAARLEAYRVGHEAP
jgi:predicted dehydrogenase